MQKSLQRIARLFAATASVSVAGQFLEANTLTTGIAVPFTSTADPASTTPVTYTTLNLNSTSASTSPNGSYMATSIGTATGKTNDANAANVNTAFAYDPINGFRLIGKYTYTSIGGHSNTNVRGVNGVGQVIGSSPVNSAMSSDVNGILGTDAWLYTTADNGNISLGLTGANFNYTKNVPVNGTITPVAFSGQYHISTPSYISSTGKVLGTTNRFAGDLTSAPTTSLGTSAWLYSGGTTAEIGLVTGNYTYNATTGTTQGRFSSNSVLTMNAAGRILGTASAYYDRGDGTATTLGQDGWIANGTSTPTPIGMYLRGGDPDVQGFNSLGYKYYGTPTGAVGGTPATSQVRSTSFTSMNASGQVVGASQYYSGAGFKGTDAFVYTPDTGTYRQVGFYGNTGNFSNGVVPPAGSSSFVSNAGARGTTASFINDAGKIVGTSTQYLYYNNASSVSTPASGMVAWIDDGTGNTARIGLYGQAADPLPGVHVNPQTGVTSSSITNLTQSGLVGGFSSRYYLNGTTGTGLGQDAWVYNSNTGTTYLLDLADASLGNFTSSSIQYLSEDGYAVGIYSVSSTTSSSGSFNKAFLWSATNGFVDLGTSLSPSLSASGYQNLIQSYYTSAGGGTVYATGSLTGAASPTTVGGLVVISVPEPTSMAGLLALGGGLSLGRRRRSGLSVK